MANPRHIAILENGVSAWNEWREKNPLSPANLSGADLTKLKLPGANLTGANLVEAHLAEGDLTRANLYHANMTGANLSGANLYRTNLTKADLGRANLSCTDLRGANLTRTNLTGTDVRTAKLRGANLSGANLTRANLSGADLIETYVHEADLSEANLSGVDLQSTMFSNVDLSSVRGLDCVRHIGPSTIGIDTLYRSGGKIPEVFLQGVGVPDSFITYAKSLVGSAIEFYSCFISYSNKDQEFADRLHADLRAKGVRCWFAPHDMQSGRKIHEQIDDAIRLHDKLLLILSPSSMESEWVKTEISKARKREIRDKARVLFPISLAPFEAIRDWECFDADAGKDSAREIREYFIPDFSTWKDHDSYQKAFNRLLKDLKATTQHQA